MNRFKGFVLLAILLLGIWLLLTAPFSMQELIVGAALAIIIALLPTRATRVFQDIRITPRARENVNRRDQVMRRFAPGVSMPSRFSHRTSIDR